MTRTTRSKRLRLSALAGLTALALTAAAGIAHATPLEQDPALTAGGEGLDYVAEGVGLEEIGGGTASIQVDIGGPVQQAWLYWGGRLFFGEMLTDQDQVLLLDGNEITGELVGTEFQPNADSGDRINLAYRADVTSIVQAAGIGLQSFDVADGDLASNLTRLNGATLLVYFTDEADPQTYQLLGYDGLDFAYILETLEMNQITVPVAIMYGAEDAARTGKLHYSVGDPTAPRDDRVEISDNPDLVNTLDDSAGPSWDADTISIDIPAFVDQTVVEVVSPAEGKDPDSLLWTLTVLRLPVTQPFCGDGEVNQPDEQCDDGNNDDGDGCSATCQIEPTGGEGCTPGFWKNHLDHWDGYLPTMSYDDVFGVSSTFPAETLIEVVTQGGGGEKALGRHAVAALLNAANLGVDYAYGAGGVIDLVQSAYDSGDFDGAKSLLEGANEEGCPLSGGNTTGNGPGNGRDRGHSIDDSVVERDAQRGARATPAPVALERRN